MPQTNATHTLPIWVLLTFTVLLIGLVTLIYTRGNWRTTLSLVGVGALAVFGISGIDAFSTYLNTHFIGQFDQLGIPFREAGPGWAILSSAWPLWVVPALFAALISLVANYLFQLTNAQIAVPSTAVTELQTSLPVREPIPIPAPEPVAPFKNLGHTLELESLKQELAITREKLSSAISIAEESLDKNQDLEIEIDQLKEEHQENIAEFEDKLTALELEISAKETESEELTSMLLQQSEEIAKLKDQLEHQIS